jgi:hypothetical protein
MTTEKRLALLLAAPPDRLAAVDCLLRGEAHPHDQIMRRSEVAALARRSRRTISLWARAGILTPVLWPGRRRAIGFRQSQVHQLLFGGAVGQPVHQKPAAPAPVHARPEPVL